MVDLPAADIAPAEFFERWLPEAFAAAELPPGTRDLDLLLGVRLEGEGGGEWLLHLRGGALEVRAAPRDEAAFTVVQSVEDWRGALFEGRGGPFGRQAAGLFRPGEAAAAGPELTPAILDQLRALRGLIRMVVSGPAGEWSVAFQLGPGEIPSEPTTTVTVSEEDAAAMERGELDPLQAFMAGRVRIAGDMALLMQMQAIQMQAQAGG